MQSRDFCYWLQGVFEVSNPKTLDADQLQIIKNHLNMVFEHEIDPSMGSKEHQDKLKDVHDGKKPPGIVAPVVRPYNPHFEGPRRITC